MGTKHWGKTQPRLPTEEELDVIIEGVSAGLALGTAAKAVGIPPQMFQRWVDKGEYRLLLEENTELDPSPTAEIFKNVTLRVWKAQAAFQREVVKDILSTPAWQGKMSILKANFPGTFQPDQKITVKTATPQISRAVTLRDVRSLSSADLEALRDMNSRRQGAQAQLEDQNTK